MVIHLITFLDNHWDERKTMDFNNTIKEITDTNMGYNDSENL